MMVMRNGILESLSDWPRGVEAIDIVICKIEGRDNLLCIESTGTIRMMGLCQDMFWKQVVLPKKCTREWPSGVYINY